MTSGGTDFSALNGPPGAALTRKKVVAITINNTGIDWSNLLKIKRNISLLSPC